MKSYEAGTIAWHRDAGVTSCPGKNLYTLLPDLKKMVVQGLAKGVLVSYIDTMKKLPTVKDIKDATFTTQKGLDLLKNWQPSFW